MQEVSIEKRGRQAAQAKALFGFARELGRVRRENIIWLDRHPWFLKFSSIDPKQKMDTGIPGAESAAVS